MHVKITGTNKCCAQTCRTCAEALEKHLFVLEPVLRKGLEAVNGFGLKCGGLQIFTPLQDGPSAVETLREQQKSKLQQLMQDVKRIWGAVLDEVGTHWHAYDCQHATVVHQRDEHLLL